MVLSPPVLALLGCSAIICALSVIAAAAGLTAAIGWNHLDSRPKQLARERRWLLVESSVRLILGLQLLSLAVFIATVDHLKSLFTGAMCAVGSLNASPLGFPTLFVKMAAFLLCALWLVTDRASPAAASTGLVRFKALSLLLLAGMLVGENLLQILYFTDLDPEVITSCCATLFNREAAGIGPGIASLPLRWSQGAFFGGLAVTLATGAWVVGGRRSPLVYSVFAAMLGLITFAAVITWIGPAYYQLPTHHCPLCLLAGDQSFIGYPLYLFLAAAVVTGVGCGVVYSLRGIDPLGCISPRAERRLCAVSLTSFILVAAIALLPSVASPIRLEVF